MMQGRREEDNSMFETSHVLGALLASTPLLAQAWRQCGIANAAGSSFAVKQCDDAVYVAFSGMQPVQPVNYDKVVPIGSGDHGLFAPLAAGGEGDGEEPVLVHACALQLFLALYNTAEFKLLAAQTRNKAVIFTGHSIGGSLASLATLYFLCSSSQSTSPSCASLLCITFGSPLLGNEALSRAVLRERWGDKFCHVVAQHDIMPRLLFCPLSSIPPHIVAHLLHAWQFSPQHPQFLRPAASQLSNEEKAGLHLFVSMHIEAAATEQKTSAVAAAQQKSPYRPFGNYTLCSPEGAVCIDIPLVVVRMLYWTFVTRPPSSSFVEEHLVYGDLVTAIPQQLLLKKRIAVGGEVPKSNYSAGVLLALEASGIRIKDMGAMEASECLKLSKRMGRSPNLNCANLAIRLGKITPCRAQIEWYKASCDDDMGYYDTFKLRKASKKDSKVNMNRIKLARFWDDLIEMLRNNELPHDFHKRSKWVNAAHFYKLLVEPLDIAEYYRGRMHRTRGHYLAHGRERRYEVFDRWWRDRKKDLLEETSCKRSKFAGLTQDSCFWAKLEEAREWINNARVEEDPMILAQLWENLNGFERYASQMVERKEVSRDVLAPRSSYSLWVEEWKDLKLKSGMHITPGFLN